MKPEHQASTPSIPAGTTNLGLDLEWQSTGMAAMEGCTCTYAGKEYEGETDGEVSTGFVYNEGTNKCTCKFPCIPQVSALEAGGH